MFDNLDFAMHVSRDASSGRRLGSIFGKGSDMFSLVKVFISSIFSSGKVKIDLINVGVACDIEVANP